MPIVYSTFGFAFAGTAAADHRFGVQWRGAFGIEADDERMAFFVIDPPYVGSLVVQGARVRLGLRQLLPILRHWGFVMQRLQLCWINMGTAVRVCSIGLK